ncbi:extracellular solute-binding protein [Bacillaceae bacterium SIJ1]|uniref:ABC transporter substrate-binding protein n=1 Tax=Litoribacterium kuwaitense TaxID=1398745 RepID=UPI0013EE006A|nr:extracellular solute-binding protein [Litoribacterium kuwaitense]NGP45700.1 extracellular solute-binding protein [Litoribacterium kuwaitense]
MIRKKGIVGFLMVLMVFSATACGSGQTDRSTGENATEKVELLYMTHIPENETQEDIIANEVIGAFEEANPNISVKWVHNEDPVSLIRQQMVAGAGPDVVLVDGPTQVMQFAKSDYLLPLDDFAATYGWEDRYFDWAYNTGFVDGKLYGLPGQYESMVVWYNKDIFAEKGWEEPQNFAEFMNLNLEIQNEGLIPFAFGTTDFRPANEWWLSLVYNSYLGAEEMKKVLKNDVPWTSDLVREATTLWKDIWQEGYINEKKSHAISGDDAWSLFRSEQAVMKMDGTWATATLTTEPTDFETDFFVMPSWREGVEPTLPMALGESAGINASTEHPEEAALLLDWLFSDEVGSIMFNQGYFYPNQGIEPPEDVQPLVADVYKGLNRSIEAGNTGFASWTYWGPNVQYYLWDNIDQVFLDQMSVEDYLAEAQKNAEKDEEEGLLFNFEN